MTSLRRFMAHALLAVGILVITIIVVLVLWLLPEKEADELLKELVE